MFIKYSKEVEIAMKNHFDGLDEKAKRLYAGVEAMKLGHGSRTYISSILNYSRRTISKGIKEAAKAIQPCNKIRNPGGGRKSILENNPEIEVVFHRVIENYIAGSPMGEVVWTHLKEKEIAELMSKEKEGFVVSEHIVRQLLKKNNFKSRKMQKDAVMSEPEDRNLQFLKIEGLKEEYLKSNNPIISIDVKKKS